MSVKPTLSLSTPVTANFPQYPPSASELRSAISLPSAISERTPLSAISRSSAFRDPIRSGLPSAGLPSAGPYSASLRFDELQKTPITPPVAYLDFLRSMSLASPGLASPPQTGRSILNRTSTLSNADSNTSSNSDNSANSEESDKDKDELIDSAPTTARSDVSCECPDKESEKVQLKIEDTSEDVARSPKPAQINTKLVPAPIPKGPHYPMSAPATGPHVFPSMKLPASPAVSNAGPYSPRSPLSAASVKSAFDWEAALKSRRTAEAPGSACKRPARSETPPAVKAAAPTTPTRTKRESRSSIRHIREVVTRTVTYTPRMAPAPKGKRRKLDSETAVES